MSTTPSEPGGMRGPGTGGMPGTWGGARMPIPGNAEFVVWLLILIMLAIIALASDGLDSHGFAWDATILTGAYLLSRGIAKASRVLEQ